ncbi:EamA family transporter [Planotetraspora kaengkrachanensis]|uniref:EamA family transporter n=1 Tax=Planotetraspora kaengkrachanensis TaxID=575193 RepID=UPI00194434A9|nr:EamA family transporter [Planotetraspora kaengkrachanensis]
MILAVALALLSAIAFGVSDFLGGLAAMRLRVVPATAIIYLFSTFILAILVVLGDGEWSPASVLAGSAAGLLAIIGFLTFYAALALGPMSLASPLIAVLESVVPIAVAVARGERLTPWSWVAVTLAVASGILISVRRRSDPARVRVRTRTVVLSVVAGVSLGLSIVSLDLAPDESGLTSGLVESAVGLIVLAPLLALPAGGARARHALSLLDGDAVRARPPSPGAGRVPGIAAGVLLGGANALLLLALGSGSLAVVSVLVNLYPLATIALSRVALNERMAPAQALGVALALTATVLLAFAQT